MLSSSTSRNVSRLATNLYKTCRRNYGLPASAISLGTDPRKDKTVQLTPLRGVNVLHDPLLSKGKLVFFKGKGFSQAHTHLDSL